MNKEEIAERVRKETLQKVQTTGNLSGLKVSQIDTLLTQYLPSIKAALPKHLTPERMIQMSTQLISRNPKIAECSVQSVIGAVMQASILGFEPVEALGYCYFVPYGKSLQFQIGYKGYISLARKSGEIKQLYAEVVRSDDEFSYEIGLNPSIKHIPGSGDGEVTHVYAVAHFKDGGYQFVVLTRKQVEKLRLRNTSQKATPSGAWATDYEAMAKGKALKQLSKYLPLSIEASHAIVSDEAVINEAAWSKDNTGINPEGLMYEDTTAEEMPSPEQPSPEPPAQEPPAATQPESNEIVLGPNDKVF